MSKVNYISLSPVPFLTMEGITKSVIIFSNRFYGFMESVSKVVRGIDFSNSPRS